PTSTALPPSAPKVLIAIGVDPTFAPQIVAVKRGFLQAEGVNAELKAFDDGNVALDTLLTGAGDVGGTSELGGLVRIARGGKIYVAGRITQHGGFFGLAGKDSIKQPKDLEGKSVGVPRGSGAHLFLAKYATF